MRTKLIGSPQKNFMGEVGRQHFKIQDQDITVLISLGDGAKDVAYGFQSPEPLHPVIVAMAMLCIVQTIFIDNNVDISEVLNIREKDNLGVQ